ncbi:TniQ family protein [Thioclava litoralis]|uniref:TniQ family protein n=1 Tax=Thioclava litoralis TaxID=3076557 RepID=A0ABZ1E1S6_9RHOB|nr:TniQ family protein [Thioclava sp. FTW29]
MTDAQLAELLSWTGERMGDVRMRYRGEVMVSRALRNPIIRGCPICLRGDSKDERPPLRKMVMQGSWLCRGVNVCVEHNHMLVPLWQETTPIVREDIGARLTAIWPDLRDGRLDQPLIEPPPYDRWLDDRLSGRGDQTWLAGQSLFAAMTFCGLLGAELQCAQGLAEDDWSAKALGFRYASAGPIAIEDAFTILSTADDGNPDVSRRAFGALFDKLEYIYRDDPDFDAFRALLRAHVIRIWPLAAGEPLLGQPLEERLVHSLLSASQETKIVPGLLDALLTEAGVFAEGDQRLPSRKIFDARIHSDLLGEIATRVGPKAMRDGIGATLTEFRALVAEGVLAPRSKLETVKNPWHLPDGLALLQDLEHPATPLPAGASGWETIHLASKQVGLPVARIVEAIREGRLQPKKLPEVFGYHGIVVELAALEMLQEQQMAAAAFARLIGLRDYAAFTALIEAGHVPATQVKSVKTARLQWMMSDTEITAFRQRFVTPTMITEETGLHRNTIFAVFSAASVRLFRPDGLDAGPIYLRNESMPAITDYLAKR